MPESNRCKITSSLSLPIGTEIDLAYSLNSARVNTSKSPHKAAIILGFLGKTGMDAMHEAKLADANKAFLTLQTKADDTEALQTLKAKNPALFELFSYAQAVKTQDIKVLNSLVGSKNEVIADSSKYVVATLDNKSSDSKLYKEMALLQEAYLAIKAGDTKSAKEKIELIDERSSLATLASLLNHSTIKAK